MRPLSPAEAIIPAFHRTRSVLLEPFRVGRSWKLCFCAYIAACGALFVPFPVFYLAVPRHAFGGDNVTLFLRIASFVLCVLMFGFFYLGSRLQFVLFDFVLSPSPSISSLWRRYGERTWPWIGLKLAITLPLALVVLLPLIPVTRHLFALMPELPFPSQQPDPRLFSLIVSLYGVLIAAMSLLLLVSSLLSDFLLPQLALEQVSAREALRRMGLLCLQEPLTLLGYLGLRILLALLGFMLQYAVSLLCMLIVGVVLGALAALGWFTLHTVLPQNLLVAGGVVFYLIFIASLIYLQLGSFGVLIIFLRAFSLFFFGGRYPPLGEILEPQALPGPPPLPASTSLHPLA